MSNTMGLPESADSSTWTPQEARLIEAAGLVTTLPNGKQELAPESFVEAFLNQVRRTQLDPLARQIYAINRRGRWSIQISIDGARLTAERSKEYQGQTPVEWTGDGEKWVQVWLKKEAPAAARVGVYRAGFQEPMIAVANFSAYSAGGPMWSKMPALMIGKTAEMLALRKAFPQDLSGLYSSEEMDQADAPEPKKSGKPEVKRVPSQDWFARATKCQTKGELRDLFKEVKSAGELQTYINADDPEGDRVEIGDMLTQYAAKLPETVEAPSDGTESEGVPDDADDTVEPVSEPVTGE